MSRTNCKKKFKYFENYTTVANKNIRQFQVSMIISLQVTTETKIDFILIFQFFSIL